MEPEASIFRAFSVSESSSIV